MLPLGGPGGRLEVLLKGLGRRAKPSCKPQVQSPPINTEVTSSSSITNTNYTLAPALLEPTVEVPNLKASRWLGTYLPFATLRFSSTIQWL